MWLGGYDAWKTREPAEDCGPACNECGGWLRRESSWTRLWYCERCDVSEPLLTRCVVERDDLGGSYDRGHLWLATKHGVDLDVRSGRGSTALHAIADLLWELGIEDVDPADVAIVWEGECDE